MGILSGCSRPNINLFCESKCTEVSRESKERIGPQSPLRRKSTWI